MNHVEAHLKVTYDCTEYGSLGLLGDFMLALKAMSIDEWTTTADAWRQRTYHCRNACHCPYVSHPTIAAPIEVLRIVCV
jgi:hypothetical protein